ncbi:MAG: GNAT family N-acetyltransferase [Hyphomonadaceae bacterium]|nr:GNAT family N-acetyltransferase [Hyphomonadaceae bacterium]
MSIRLYRPSDFSRVFAANEASVPGVGKESEANLAQWIELSTCLVAADAEDEVLGFITVMEIGQPSYDSPNMRWFETYAAESGKSLVYVDRIALLPEARGQRLGEALYKEAFQRFEADEIGCEVNTLPPNPGSHRFHERLGFKPVGDATYKPGEKAVRFYTRSLV